MVIWNSRCRLCMQTDFIFFELFKRNYDDLNFFEGKFISNIFHVQQFFLYGNSIERMCFPISSRKFSLPDLPIPTQSDKNRKPKQPPM